MRLAERTIADLLTSYLGLAMFREFFRAFLGLVRDALRGRSRLMAENALLRQQVIVLGRSAPRPRLKPRDRWSITDRLDRAVGSIGWTRFGNLARTDRLDRPSRYGALSV